MRLTACDPAKNRFDRRISYPGAASLQMMAAYDPAAGLLLASRDSQAYAKVFCAGQRGKWLELGIAHQLPHTPVTEWELGYDVALAGLRPASGMKKITWEAAADLYRRWAEKQPWCRQTMAERVAAGDIPKWIVEPTLFLTFSLRGQTSDGTPGNRLPLVIEQVDRWSQVIGAPITGIPVSWEKHDTWVTPDYFPPLPSVLHSAWKLPDGHAGTIFACIHDEPVEFTFGEENLSLEPGEAVFRSSR